MWNEGDDHQNNDCDTNEWGRFTDNRHQGLLGHVRDDEEQQTERRREQSNHDIDDNHDTEMNEIDSQCLSRWNQDWNDYEENRGSLKETSQDKQYRVDEKQIPNGSQLESSDEVLYRKRNVFDRDYVIEDQCPGDQHSDRSSRLSA